MTPVSLTVNGRAVGGNVEARMHLADFLRERLNLTATHLRCEQGPCGACTLLIDGQPARSCITYVGLCDGADVTTVEGLEDDPVIVSLRRAFSIEHGLQCGYCTPGMLITARDIVLRLPDADAERIRLELSGNLCRCTGYVGIVRAISRVLDERRQGALQGTARSEAPIGPVGARVARPQSGAKAAMPGIAPAAASSDKALARTFGLDGRQPNVEIRQSFTVSRPPEEVWSLLADTARVVRCVPGASLAGPPAGDNVAGTIAVKLGPITANFAGEARIVRDAANCRGTILGAGSDRLGGSRAAGELEYALEPAAGGTRVVVTIRALLTGPLAQFGRSGIVEDLVARLTATFAQNLEARLGGAASDEAQAPLAGGSLLWQVTLARVKRLFARAPKNQTRDRSGIRGG